MAYDIIREEHNKHQVGTEIVAILDEASDLDALGADWEAGSLAIVADKGAPAYMMNASGEWREI